MKLPKPTKDKIFAERLPEEKSPAGIIMASANLNKYRCKVLAIGPKVEVVKVGDVLRYDHQTAVDYPWEGKPTIFLEEEKNVLFIM